MASDVGGSSRVVKLKPVKGREWYSQFVEVHVQKNSISYNASVLTLMVVYCE